MTTVEIEKLVTKIRLALDYPLPARYIDAVEALDKLAEQARKVNRG